MKTFDKRKAFGQHFLSDPKIISQIVDAAMSAVNANAGCSILEIGPGQGAITRPLLQVLPIEVPFFLAERDRVLIEEWEAESRVAKFLKGDFLDQADSEIDSLGPMVVVSNLPYSAGTAIVVRLCERAKQISEMVLMFQAEVAKRLYAVSSTPDRGSLSLYIQNEWVVERIIVVPPAAFKPPPKVQSEVVRLRRREKPFIALPDEETRARFNDLLKHGFKHRRKMIRGNYAGTKYEEALKKSGVDPTRRAESLEWDQWIALWQAI